MLFKLVVLATIMLDTQGLYIPFLSGKDVIAHVATQQPPAEQAPQQVLAVAGAVAATPALAANPQPAAPAAVPQDSLTREALQQKQEELNRREQELNRVQQEVNQKIQNLQDLEMRLQTMLKQAEEAKDKKMRHLVDVYSNMKAKQAAEVLSSLDESIAVRILAGMRGRQAGEVLTFVKADKAARLSEALTKMQLPFE